MVDFHYFLALPLSNETKRRIAAWSRRVQPELPFKKWVHEKDYHITLFFLGAAESAVLSNLADEIRKYCAVFPRFSLNAGDTGYFGRPDAPKILWAGVQCPEELLELQRSVAKTCVSHGFSKETRPYQPHITLARKWEGKDSFLRRIAEVPSLETMPLVLEEVVLYRTHLNKEPKYEAVERFLLQ